MTGYTSLLLDLDDTLLDFKAAEAFAIRQVLKANSLPSDDNAVSTYSKINKSFWESFERGEISKAENEDDMKNYRHLLAYQRKLEREKMRIQYKLGPRKQVPSTALAHVDKDD